MNNKQNILIQLNGENIREIDKFIYFGSIVSKDGGVDNDVKSCINKVRYVFNILC